MRDSSSLGEAAIDVDVPLIILDEAEFGQRHLQQLHKMMCCATPSSLTAEPVQHTDVCSEGSYGENNRYCTVRVKLTECC